MEKKYKKIGLDYNSIIDKYKNIDVYEEIVNSYLSDPFFNDLKKYIEDKDYALAKDATKGLFILAQDLLLYPLYICLVDLYEDFEDEKYEDVESKYKEMIKVYKNIKEALYV